MSTTTSTINNHVLDEARRAWHHLLNDPPNGVTTSRAIAALQSAGDEIERLHRFGVHMLIVHEQRSRELAERMIRDARTPDHDPPAAEILK